MIVCSMGGGFSSTAWLPRVLLEQYPKEEIRFVTCVLPNEHPSTWELYDAVEAKLNIKVEYIAYSASSPGYMYVHKADRTNKALLETPNSIFVRKKFLGNSRLDPCSAILKRGTMTSFVKEEYPDGVKMAVGIHAEEFEREISIRKNWGSMGVEAIFPLLYLKQPENKISLLKEWYGVSLPLYELGFEHNNCHGACIKAGQKQWALLWYYYPDVYEEWEGTELFLNSMFSEQHTILRIMEDGVRKPITLRDFRLRLQSRLENGSDDFVSRYIRSLPGMPGCTFCEAI